MDEMHELAQDVHPVTGIHHDYRNFPFEMDAVADSIADPFDDEEASKAKNLALRSVPNYDAYVKKYDPEVQETLLLLADMGYRFCINVIIHEWNTLPNNEKKDPSTMHWYSRMIYEAIEGRTSPYPEILTSIRPPCSEVSGTP